MVPPAVGLVKAIPLIAELAALCCRGDVVLNSQADDNDLANLAALIERPPTCLLAYLLRRARDWTIIVN